jgi:molybdate transport system ATP-binding protein
LNNLIISLNEVTVHGRDRILFEDLNFSISQGEHCVLTGASGSGNSALLDTIAGKFHISKGSIEHPYFDRHISPEQKRDPLYTYHKLIAQVSSHYNFRNLSNTGNFYYQQRFNSCDSEDAKTVKEYLEAMETGDGAWTPDRVARRLNLKSLSDKHLIKLSNGETKRLLIASALVRNPVLLLLDNPFTGLDTGTRDDLNDLLSEIAASGISVIMSTSPTEIPDLITHVAVLENQKITAYMPRRDFRAEQVKISPSQQTDADELKELFNIPADKRYKTIVGMKDVVIRYGDKVILDHVSWQVNQGERWALLGHNGAGKSTLLSLINGDNPQAYANDITLFDKKRGSGESIWEIKNCIGFVSAELFQYFPTDNTCLQVTESGFYDTLGLFRPSSPANGETARRWMRLLEIEDSCNKLFKNVSASTQRLCLLARALVKNPPLLIFDEPCQGLDPHQQEHFKRLVDTICKNSIVTMIYVSHYPQEIPSAVEHTLLLENGRIS